MAERALEDSHHYRAEVMPKVAAANRNLAERIRLLGMEIQYFPDDDRLYVNFGPARPSEALPIGDGTHGVILLDPETYEITAVEAPFFREDIGRLKPRTGFWRLVIDLIDKRSNHVSVPPEAEYERTESALLDLLPAP